MNIYDATEVAYKNGYEAGVGGWHDLLLNCDDLPENNISVIIYIQEDDKYVITTFNDEFDGYLFSKVRAWKYFKKFDS